MQVCALLAAPLAASLKWYGSWTVHQVVPVCALLLHPKSLVKLQSVSFGRCCMPHVFCVLMNMLPATPSFGPYCGVPGALAQGPCGGDLMNMLLSR